MAMADATEIVSHDMDRLDFTLPDFTRLAWVSDRASEVWKPRIARIGMAWAEIEWRSVLAGVRRCALTMASPEEFMDRGAVWAGEGLASLPVEMAGVSAQPYSATGLPVTAGQPFLFRFVTGLPSDIVQFKKAWDNADQEGIGDLLGYPPCCREFFRRTWVDDALVDTTWPMAVASTAPAVNAADDANSRTVDGPAQANILWRWMGVRAVPHLPCRFDCPTTVDVADQYIAVGRSCGFDQEMDWLLEILSWPVEWSALHGIAEIKTPVVKVSTRTDATASKYVVRRVGDQPPGEALPGLSFPFEAPVTLRLTASRGFQRGLQHAVAVGDPPPAWYATDNGFPSVDDMDKAHLPVVAAALAAIHDGGGNVIDLGCGNGALLAKLRASCPGVVPFGIDHDPASVDHARVVHGEHRSNFDVVDLFDPGQDWAHGRRFALAIIMPGRLTEATPEQAIVIRERLRASCEQVLLYAYGDWLTRFAGLANLAAAAGLALIGPSDSPAALANMASLTV